MMWRNFEADHYWSLKGISKKEQNSSTLTGEFSFLVFIFTSGLAPHQELPAVKLLSFFFHSIVKRQFDQQLK